MGQVSFPLPDTTTRDFTQLRVVSSASWLARDLARAGTVPVVGDLGLDIPAETDGTAWWCPGLFAARLHATGVPVPFAGPPAPWQAAIAGDWLGRDVRAATLAELTAAGWDLTRPAFAKPADVKAAAVPARWWPRLSDFVEAATAAGLPPSTPVLVCRTRVQFETEYRCFVADGQVVAASMYRDGDQTWDAWDEEDAQRCGAAVTFAERVVESLADQPDGWVLDVGQSRDGTWMVVEANPSWCANPYHCESAGVVRSVLAAQRRDGDRRWLWQPGDWLKSRALPLPRR